MIIATVWCEGYPLGVELKEDEIPFSGLPIKMWAATGNFAFCRGVNALEDFIKTTKKECETVSDAYWVYARKNWLHP